MDRRRKPSRRPEQLAGDLGLQGGVVADLLDLPPQLGRRGVLLVLHRRIVLLHGQS
jgi:hypothetical protein